jgi:undecaprenyl-diphosphatase
MIPGTSRSGATIIGGLLLKLDRKTATEFSFFLAIPTIFAATVFDLYKNINTLTFSNIEFILIGTLSAFLSAILVIKWFINFVSKNNFVIFGIYRIVVGIIILFFITI